MTTLSSIITPTNIVTAQSTTTLTNKTIDGANNTISNIDLGTDVTGTLAQSSLANSSLTVNGVTIALGGSNTITSNAETLTGTSLNSTVVGSSLTSVGTLSSLNVSGNVVAGNINSSNLVVANGNIQGQYFIGDGSKLTGIAPTVQVYETANIASGINGYYTNQWLGDYTQGTLGNVTATVSSTATFIAGFITEAGFPNITVLPIGSILVNIETQKGGGPRAYSAYAEIYARTTGGTETLLVTTDTSSPSTDNTVIQQNLLAYILAPVTLASTDRIVVKIYAQTDTSTADISVRFDGGTESALQLPALPASISNFVPYIGATANLNLGSYSFTTTGNVTGAHIIGEGGNLSNIQGGNVTGAVAFATTANAVSGGNVSGQVSNALVSGTVYTNAQPNITSVGTLTSLEVTGSSLFGDANIGNLVVRGTTTTANVTDLDVANLTIVIASGANSLVANGSGLYIGNDTSSVAHLQYLDASTSWNSSVLFQAPNFTTTGNVTAVHLVGEAGNLSNITAANITGTVASATVASSANSVAGANVSGQVSFAATANSVAGANVSGAVASATSAASANSVTGANVTGTVSSATTAGTVTTAAQGNITSVGTLTSLAVSGALTTTQITTGANTTTGNITGTWTLTTGSTLEATYADLAEKYVADTYYEPGTVVQWGGEKEITMAEANTSRVAGVVSTNPAYIMNGECSGEHVVTLALQGRVPCRVTGAVRKGDMMVSAGLGLACASATPTIGTVIGKAIEDFDGNIGVIEIVVDRF